MPITTNGGQTHAQSTSIAEHAIENLVGAPVSLREMVDLQVADLSRTHKRDQEIVADAIETRERELRRSLEDAHALQDHEVAFLQELIKRIEVDLRREVAHASELRAHELQAVREQIEQVQVQNTQREIASKEAVTKAETAATTAISNAAATTATAVTKAEQAAALAIDKAADATKSAIDSLQETFRKDIVHLREIIDGGNEKVNTYISIHRDVHGGLQLASDKFEAQSKETLKTIEEFRGSSERRQENFVPRDSLEEVRRGLERSTLQRFETLVVADERAENATNSRFQALEQRHQATTGRDSANTQYTGYLFLGFGFLLTLLGIGIAVASLVTR